AAVAAEAGVDATAKALDYWADVTGVRPRLRWWLDFLGGIAGGSPPAPPGQPPGALSVGDDPLPPKFGGAVPAAPGRGAAAAAALSAYSGPDGELRFYLDAALPLPVTVSQGTIVQGVRLLIETGLEDRAIDAWTASEWAPAAPGLAAVQGGTWSRDEIR